MIQEFDVIVIGGGITGAGTARDCALRGLKVLLIEKGDLDNGASGRNHGLLHSGARYAMTDRASAEECISENKILRRIASNCVEETGGLFITLPGDDLDYQREFIRNCRAAGISAEAIDPALARRLEPSVNPELVGAVKVPDASVDPFRLTTANVLDASIHGASVLTYTKVESLLTENGRVTGVSCMDLKTGSKSEYRASITVNAAGIWGAEIASMAGCTIGMLPSKGSLLVFGHRVNKMVINRCRKPSNADILVPGDVVCVLGTTSDKVGFDQCENIGVTASEVELLLREGTSLAPVLADTRVLRAYAGVRPLVASDGDASGRSVSRGMVLLDHETRDSVPGFISITGGKLTTYRLMAQEATDLVCRKLGVNKACTTACRPLPGSERRHNPDREAALSFKAAEGRHGGRIRSMDFASKSEVLCECEHVTRAEIAYAVKELGVNSMISLRRRTRVGMGTCQGSFCMKRVAAALAEELGDPGRTDEFIREYVQERWKGMVPVCWGESLREAEYMRKRMGGKTDEV